MNRIAEIPMGSTVLDAIRSAEITFESICGGKGECGKCRVIHVRGDIDTGILENTPRLTPAEIAGRYVLACKTQVLSNAEFIIPVESRIDTPKILLTASWKSSGLQPAVARYSTGSQSEQPGKYRSFSLTGYSGKRPDMTRDQYEQLRDSPISFDVTITSASGYPEVLFFEDSGSKDPIFGIAIDLGTTTVVGALVDLSTGKVVAEASVLNRQITYGEELITRIVHARVPEGREQLRKAALESINAVIDLVAGDRNVSHERIADATIAGNTVMLYLLAGIDTHSLELVDANVPRVPARYRASTLGIGIYPQAYVYCLPNVSRFVGGDAVGDVLVSGMHRSSDLSLLVDLGTNGEIVFGNNEWLVCSSCASGPAFEGAGIRSGMRAMKGAIEHVAIDASTGKAALKTIGNSRPIGICGSGIIDAAAEMAAAGILDFTGRIVEGKPGVRRGPTGDLEYVLAPMEETGTGRDIAITSVDLAYLMDSKAAACGAVGVLMNKYRISLREVRNVFLAGAFGSFTDLEQVTAFGILPQFPHASYHPLGNGSLGGAYMALTSLSARREAEEIAQKMVYVDLLVESDFIEEYTAALYIPGKKEYFPPD